MESFVWHRKRTVSIAGIIYNKKESGELLGLPTYRGSYEETFYNFLSAVREAEQTVVVRW